MEEDIYFGYDGTIQATEVNSMNWHRHPNKRPIWNLGRPILLERIFILEIALILTSIGKFNIKTKAGTRTLPQQEGQSCLIGNDIYFVMKIIQTKQNWVSNV